MDLGGRGGPRDQRITTVKSEDPLKVADKLGRPMAILRMGSRIPDMDAAHARFIYGSPPLVKHYKRGTAPWEVQAKQNAQTQSPSDLNSASRSPALPYLDAALRQGILRGRSGPAGQNTGFLLLLL